MFKKKVLSMILLATMTMSYGSNCFAQEVTAKNVNSEEIYMSPLKITTVQSDQRVYYKMDLNPYNKSNLGVEVNSLGLEKETIDAIQDYSDKCQSGEIKNGELSVMVSGNPYSRSVRTYKGFGNRNYKEELILSNNTSSAVPKLIKSGSSLKTYLNTTINAGATFLVDKAANYISGGTWSIGKLFVKGLPSGVPTNTSFRHESRLVENVIKKFTYIQNNDGYGGYSFGSRVTKGDYHFTNVMIIPGKDPIVQNSTPTIYVSTPNYNNADKKAYYGYVNGGYIENFSSYKYGGINFNSVGM